MLLVVKRAPFLFYIDWGSAVPSKITLTNYPARRKCRESDFVLTELTRRSLSAIHKCRKFKRHNSNAREAEPFVVEPIIDRGDIQLVSLAARENPVNDGVQNITERRVVGLGYLARNNHLITIDPRVG